MKNLNHLYKPWDESHAPRNFARRDNTFGQLHVAEETPFWKEIVTAIGWFTVVWVGFYVLDILMQVGI